MITQVVSKVKHKSWFLTMRQENLAQKKRKTHFILCEAGQGNETQVENTLRRAT